jgi:hypothetical protein
MRVVCLEIELVQNSFNLYWQLLQDRLTGVVRLSLEACYGLFMVLALGRTPGWFMTGLQHWHHLYDS